ELRDAGSGTGGTFPAAAPVKRIDYVTVGEGVRVRGAAVPEEAVASDHRPVVADVSLTRR
ncbi:metal-dependent hydrolase, partial [Streptomyces sp. SID5789]|nr:metal-dependent hydrolase [Streptomyces sp. SID5789]